MNFKAILVDAVVTQLSYQYIRNKPTKLSIYRVIQEDLPPLMELISEDVLSKKCHINLRPVLNIYRVTTFVIGMFSEFQF
jgi:hypothetical protein